MSYARAIRTTALVFAFSGLASPAVADGPISVYAGTAFVADPQSSESLGTVLTEVAAGYDFISKGAPVAVRADVDYTFASSVNVFGIGASARMKSPLYVGVGLGFYNVSAAESYSGPAIIVDGSYPTSKSTSASGIGGSAFIGQRLLSTKALGLALELSYREVPSYQSINPSSLNLGFRANF